MDTYYVLLECSNGHEQVLTFQGVERTWVEGFAGLVDGTSPLYQTPPGPGSTIGKCSHPGCGKQIKAMVLDRHPKAG